MRVIILILLGAAATLVTAVPARAGEPTDERPAKEKKEQKEKKGALAERPDPAKDLSLQRQNVKKLRHNAEVDRQNGNRVAAWAAERDAKHAEKLIAKDEKLLREGGDKKSVDGQAVDKRDADGKRDAGDARK